MAYGIIKNLTGFNIFAASSLLVLALSGCGGVSQETIDAADQKLNELNAMRSSVESGYGELTDDSLFSRITEAGQLLDALAESSASRYSDMSEEEIQTIWRARADELTETYSSLQELVDQSAEALADSRRITENRFDLRFHVVNNSGDTLSDLCWNIVDDSGKRILLETKCVLANGASLAGISVPANREYNSWELRLSCTDSNGENRSFHLGKQGDLNPDASFYITLDAEGKASVSAEPPGQSNTVSETSDPPETP